jgi:hypothetical protein
MSQTACKWISLMISCALLFMCAAGCGNDSGNQYRRLYEKGIVVVNGIQIRTIDLEMSEGCFAEYFEIDGLRNQQVEDQINRRIRHTMEEMQKDEFIPPYRGISLMLKQYGDLDRMYHLYISPQFNGNHILSVSADCYMWFNGEAGSTEFSYSYVIPMNFDLSTGKEIALSDFFAPGTDYIELINRNVDKQLMAGGFDGENNELGAYTALSLVSPFKSIKPEQKFLLDSDGNLRLYFDYDTPEFYSVFHPCTLTLSSDEIDGALLPFRAAGQQLFEKEEKSCRFMARYDEKSDVRSDNTDPGRSFYGRYKYLEGTPENIVKQVEAITFDSEQFPVSDKVIKKKAAKKLGRKKGFNLSNDVSTNACFNKSREYYSYIRQINYSVTADDAWTPANPDPDYFSAIYRTAYCFDSNGKRLEYRSLFRQPERADRLLQRAILRSLSITAEEMENGIGWTNDQARQLVEKMLEHINGAALEADSLSLSYDLSFQEMEDMITECLGIEENVYSVMNCLLVTSYSDIGCENLAFFREAAE